MVKNMRHLIGALFYTVIAGVAIYLGKNQPAEVFMIFAAFKFGRYTG